MSLSMTAINDRHASHRTTAGIHQKRSVASRFAWTMDYTTSGRDVGGPSQAPSKTQINHRTQRSVAGDLRQPATGTDQQGCWKFHTMTEAHWCTVADGEQFEHILSNMRLYSKIPLFKNKTLCCFSDTVLLCFGTNVFQRAKIAKGSR